jgi:DNA topoisomerase-1
MEDTLDLIAQNKQNWQETLAEFYTPFMQKITDGKKNIKSQKVLKPTGEACPECGEELVIRGGRYGEFISCSTYPKCKYTKDIDGNEKENKDEATDKICDKCGEPMVIKNSRRGKFYACSAYPKCKNTKPLVEPRKLKVPCPKCGGDILERNSKRGKFFGCANYPDCDFISKYEPTDASCPKCESSMVKKVLKKGEFLECTNKECKEKIQIG